MDYQVQLSFNNINCPEIGEYGVDHVKAAQAMGCLATRIFDPKLMAPAFQEARRLSAEKRVPVVVEVITERVTNISMGPEIDKITEFEEIYDRKPEKKTQAA
jgi:tartronate-semialdehyde synthase